MQLFYFRQYFSQINSNFYRIKIKIFKQGNFLNNKKILISFRSYIRRFLVGEKGG